MSNISLNDFPRWLFNLHASPTMRMYVELLDMSMDNAFALLPERKVILVEHSDLGIYAYQIRDSATNEWLGGCSGWDTINTLRFNIEGYYMYSISLEERYTQ